MTLTSQSSQLAGHKRKLWDTCRKEVEHEGYLGFDIPKTEIVQKIARSGYLEPHTVPRYEWVAEPAASPHEIRTNVTTYLAQLPPHHAFVSTDQARNSLRQPSNRNWLRMSLKQLRKHESLPCMPIPERPLPSHEPQLRQRSARASRKHWQTLPNRHQRKLHPRPKRQNAG